MKRPKKSVRMSIPIPTTLKNLVRRAAKRDGIPMSEYVRRALAAEIDLASRETDCERVERQLSNGNASDFDIRHYER